MAIPALAAIPAVTGLIQTAISASRASQLREPNGYTVSPELMSYYNMARRRADEGYSAEERAAFEQQLARQGTAANRMFQNMGLAGAGSAAASIMGIDALNQFAANDANIRRQNFSLLGQVAGDIQSVKNMETSRAQQQYNLESQALGQGIQAGIGNIMGAVNFAQNASQYDKAASMYSATQPQTSQPTSPQTPPANTNIFGGLLGQVAGPYPNYSLESMGTPFMSVEDPSYGQQFQLNSQPQQQQNQLPFGSEGFGSGLIDWNTIWGQ